MGKSALFFWLSLVAFATAWPGETSAQSMPVELYEDIFTFSAFAYTILIRTLIALQGKQSRIASATGRDRKGKCAWQHWTNAMKAWNIECHVKVRTMWSKWLLQT
jgi:uncharacterized membrane protein